MMRLFFTLLSICSFSVLLAQATCPDIPNFKRDYCHCMTEVLPSACAQFQSGAKEFYYRPVKGGDFKKMEMPQGDIMAYLLGLADNKKLKLGGKDLLFLQSAFTAWESKEKDIYIKKVGDNKRTAEDLAKLALEKTPSGLGFQLLKAGKGEAAQNGKTVQVHYRGYLQDGSIFDASFDRAEVFEFPLGQGRVIKGWDEGIAKLKVGDHAILRVPPALGYGSRAMGAAIPANSELIFEVVLMGIK